MIGASLRLWYAGVAHSDLFMKQRCHRRRSRTLMCSFQDHIVAAECLQISNSKKSIPHKEEANESTLVYIVITVDVHISDQVLVVLCDSAMQVYDPGQARDTTC